MSNPYSFFIDDLMVVVYGQTKAEAEKNLIEALDKRDSELKAYVLDEYSSKLWQVIEKLTVNCKLDFNIDDLRNLEIVIKGLKEQLKEQK